MASVLKNDKKTSFANVEINVKEEKYFMISESLGNEIIQFLSKLNLPVAVAMQEVAPLINGLANLQKYEEGKDNA